MFTLYRQRFALKTKLPYFLSFEPLKERHFQADRKPQLDSFFTGNYLLADIPLIKAVVPTIRI